VRIARIGEITLKTIHTVNQFFDAEKPEATEHPTRQEADDYAQELLKKHSHEVSEITGSSDNRIAYYDEKTREFIAYVETVQRSDIYDITALEIRTREPDVVNMETLSRGDKIGRWEDAHVSVAVSLPTLQSIPSNISAVVAKQVQDFLDEFGTKQSDGTWLINFEADFVSKVAATTITPIDTVLMCYVASIQPDKKFKVYSDWGDTTDIERCASRGRKVRSEALARQIFPMLSDYEFIGT